MIDSIFILLILSTFRMSLPLMFATCGGYFSEKSGVAQISLEAFLLVGAFTAASVSFFSGTLLLGYLAAGVMAALFGQIFCIFTLKLKAHSIIVGTALNLLVMGLIPIVSKSVFDSTGSTPSINADNVYYALPVTILIVTITAAFWLSNRTIWGLQMKFAGEKRLALESIGVNPIIRQWQAVTLCAFITGLGGAVLSTYLSSNYSPLMSAGRGFIALAALIFAGWSLRRALLVSLFFGFCEALQIQLQSNQLISSRIPAEFIQMIPYAATLLALIFLRAKNNPPAELR
ncbi:MAG: ABC transporter permease [Bdellovibrionaceae bacterium]|nr:ABC transporter permease [Bdellovibrio sp.]